MSDATTAAAILKEETGPFERLPLEIIIQIFSSLPNLKSILNLGLASRDFYSILSENEGAIARGFAITILEVDDPGLLKLAFMACESRIIDTTSKESIAEFIATYVRREAWPLKRYQLRALYSLPKINMAVKLIIDWVATYCTIWPLKLESKAYTETEITRLERVIYILEVTVTLFQSVEDSLPKQEFYDLSNKFWYKFSWYETGILYDDLLDFFAPTYYLTFKAWLKCTGRGKGGPLDWPWNTYDALWDTLNSMRMYWDYQRRPWYRNSRIIWAMRHNRRIGAEPGMIILRPLFARDTNAFAYCIPNHHWIRDPDRWWDVREHFFDPRAYQHFDMHKWFFAIGDRDRCESVIEQGGAWSWEGDPGEWIENTHPDSDDEEDEDEEDDEEDASPVMIRWGEDPTLFGFQGEVGTIVDIHDL